MNKELHNCTDAFNFILCKEDDEGRFIVTRISLFEEPIEFFVTFCPICGCKAKLNIKYEKSEFGTVGGFRYIKSDGTIGHLKDGETMEIPL